YAAALFRARARPHRLDPAPQRVRPHRRPGARGVERALHGLRCLWRRVCRGRPAAAQAAGALIMAAEQQARVAVVTGAAGGIGAAIAARLAGQGWRLVLSDRAGAALDQAVQACREAAYAYAEALPADVTREDDVAELVRHAVRRHGRLDGFVAAAGVAGTVRAVEEYPADVFQQVLGVNAVGTFLSLKHALPALRAAGGGSFVALGSTSSI